MSNKYFSGKKGSYVFCDICGQACYRGEAIRLDTYTGRPGLIVCPNDADNIDPGLIPYTVPAEKSAPWVRINHQDTSNGATVIDYDTATNLGV